MGSISDCSCLKYITNMLFFLGWIVGGYRRDRILYVGLAARIAEASRRAPRDDKRDGIPTGRDGGGGGGGTRGKPIKGSTENVHVILIFG